MQHKKMQHKKTPISFENFDLIGKKYKDLFFYYLKVIRQKKMQHKKTPISFENFDLIGKKY
jgi:hypothetical protein